MIYQDVLNNPEQFDFTVDSLGTGTVQSPVHGRTFIADDEFITFASQVKNIQSLLKKPIEFPAFQKAGPRQKIFFDPSKCQAGIVTCGGLCPGLNNVIKGLVTVLSQEYGVTSITGFMYGYQGLLKNSPYQPTKLTVDMVDTIHRDGGTILGSSRENQNTVELVDTLVQREINMLFCVGGDGTQRGAAELVAEIKKRNLSISIIGIPKTIDNDLRFVEKTFGFETAVHTASEVITSAHNEAEGADNGISIVKLMGRDSGFIAASATLANSVVDFCLIPEVEFTLDELFKAVKRRLDLAHHAVIVAAEGAGQRLFTGLPTTKDAAGNILKHDIGNLLKDELAKNFKKINQKVSIKYLDPSYHIRSVAAIANDAIFCYLLAENAVHAAFAGKTGMVVGYWNNYFTHVPMRLAIHQRQKVDVEGALWKGVITATRQNDYFGI